MSCPSIDIRQAIVGALSSSGTGFNDSLAALAVQYSWPNPYTIDFGPTSRSFVQSYMQPDTADWDLSQLSEFPAMSIYTREDQNLNRTKFSKFDGSLLLCIDLFIRFRVVSGALAGTVMLETNDTETIADLSRDALYNVIDTLSARDGSPLLPPNVQYVGGATCTRSPLVIYGDGRAQLVHFEIAFAAKQ